MVISSLIRYFHPLQVESVVLDKAGKRSEGVLHLTPHHLIFTLSNGQEEWVGPKSFDFSVAIPAQPLMVDDLPDPLSARYDPASATIDSFWIVPRIHPNEDVREHGILVQTGKGRRGRLVQRQGAVSSL